MELAGRAGEQRQRTAAALPAPGQRSQPGADEVAGEVLLADRRAALVPALAQLAQVGENHGREHGVGQERGEEPVECGVGLLGVEAVERVAEPLRLALQRRAVGLRRVLVGEHEARRLGRGHTGSDPLLHPPDPSFIVRGVEPQASGGARRPQQAVPVLPRPQQLWLDADAPAQLADSEVMPGVHERQCTGAIRCLYRLHGLLRPRAGPAPCWRAPWSRRGSGPRAVGSCPARWTSAVLAGVAAAGRCGSLSRRELAAAFAPGAWSPRWPR